MDFNQVLGLIVRDLQFRDAAVKDRSAIEAPAAPGVKLHHPTTVWLDGRPGGEIRHIVNDRGGRIHAGSPPSAQRRTLREFGGKGSPPGDPSRPAPAVNGSARPTLANR